MRGSWAMERERTAGCGGATVRRRAEDDGQLARVQRELADRLEHAVDRNGRLVARAREVPNRQRNQARGLRRSVRWLRIGTGAPRGNGQRAAVGAGGSFRTAQELPVAMLTERLAA